MEKTPVTPATPIKVWLPTIGTGTGTDVFTQRLAEALRAHGIAAQIDWFSQRHEIFPFALKRQPAPPGTQLIFANSWNGFAFQRPGIALVVALHHAEFGKSNPQLSLAQKLYRRLLIHRYERWSFGAAAVITAVSRFAASSLDHTAYADKVEVFHNWIDTAVFRPAETRCDAARPFRLLFVGKQSRLKGADLLGPIMQQLGDGFQLACAGKFKAGTGPGAEGPVNISSLGWLGEAELIRAYQECDALLFPSQTEGFGYAALEAMACGKPVITSNATALPELVVDGVSGILCEPADIGAYVAACRKLAADPALNEAMGQQGRKRAVELFSLEARIDDYLELIDRLVRATS